MEVWEWFFVALGFAATVYIVGTMIWAIMDILKQIQLPRTTKAFWVAVVAIVPIIGAVIWIYAKPQVLGSAITFPKA